MQNEKYFYEIGQLETRSRFMFGLTASLT